MNNRNVFDDIAEKYKEKSLVQQRAALELIKLLEIKKTESVIDVACGPGHLTDLFHNLTSGRVVGTDISEGMVEKAKAKYPALEFRHIAAEDLNYDGEFDIAFCNSALQWFTNPNKAVQAIFRALKIIGKLGLACPATSQFSPWFDRIISKVASRKEIEPVFSQWINPWFHLPEKEDYEIFFEKHGFKTSFIKVEYEEAYYSPEDAFNIYLSGAANGYVSKKHYSCEVGDDYIADFNNYVKEEIEKESKNGKTKVDFNRLYYIGKKERTRSRR